LPGDSLGEELGEGLAVDDGGADVAVDDEPHAESSAPPRRAAVTRAVIPRVRLARPRTAKP
jgi:hypothetical protein